MSDIFKEKEYRPGSQGAAEAKENKIYRIVAGVITLLVILCVYAFPTYLRDLHQRAGTVTGIVGFIFMIASYAVFYFSPTFLVKQRSEWLIGVLWLALLGIGICFACGWNFDLRGIPDRP